MRKKILTSDTIVANVFSPETERTVRWYAETLTGQRNRRVCAIRPAIREGDSSLPADSPDSVQVALRQLARADTIGLIVSDWPSNGEHMQRRLRLADELRVPAVFIRQPSLLAIERVVVATAGGPNVLELMWVAKEIASAFRAPVSILHCPGGDPETIPLEGMAVRMLGMNAAIEVSKGTDFTRCVGAYLRKNDLLVMGAPSPLRRTMAFADSIPDEVARAVKAPIVLLSSPPPSGVSLRRLFWGSLIKTGAAYRNKKDVIADLIQNLARHNQLPRSSQSDILDRALRREEIMSTAVDCETAFPVVTLRGFFGMAAALAVCPEGVAFGSIDGHPTRFFFLTITPDGLCEDYLPTLARIARRMIKPDVRQALLACETPAQVLDILEPRAAVPVIDLQRPECNRHVSKEIEIDDITT